MAYVILRIKYNLKVSLFKKFSCIISIHLFSARSIPSDLNSNGESNGETVIIQSQVEQPALYVSNQKSFANRNMPSSSNSQAQIVVSRNIPQHVETISRQSHPANSHPLQQQQNFEVRRSVPASNAGSAQHHVLSHAGAMPIPITVEPGTQVISLIYKYL